MATKKAAKKATKKSVPKEAASKKAASKKAAKGARAGRAERARSEGPAPRADKGEGEPAVRARIASLRPPVRDILEKLHGLVTKLAPSLEPTVKWGHAVYLKQGKMVLVAAPRKSYVGFGYTQVSGIRGEEPVDFHSADEVTEPRVAAFVARLA